MEDAQAAMTRLYQEYAAQPQLARLAEGKRLVPGHGPLNAPLAVVGEAPGEQEEKQGRPMVGPAGKLLQELFADAGLPWQYCYVTNVLPWRPPANRTPYPFEVQSSEQRLAAEITLVSPVIVVAAGDVAWRGFTRSALGPFAAARFRWHELDGCRLLALPHPAYLLRLPPGERETWEKQTVNALASAKTAA